MLQCAGSIIPTGLTKEQTAEILSNFRDDLLDSMDDHNFEYEEDAENGTLSLILHPEAYHDLPDTKQLSSLFSKIEKLMRIKSSRFKKH